MALDMYWVCLVVLAPLVLIAVGHGTLLRVFKRFRSPDGPEPSPKDKEASKFRKVFLRVYLVVMASEWLQGPYTYSLFSNEKGLDEGTVAMLFVAFYSSAAASAFFTGYLADRFGRRAACLAFCVIHCLATVSVMFDAVEVLFIGRALGGIALTLLWTTFESWMVTEYNARGLSQSYLRLTAMFGSMTTSNCITAILAGIIGHCLVLALGSKTDPFILGVVLDVCAAVLIMCTWNENWGTMNNRSLDQEKGDGEKDGRAEKPAEGERVESTLESLKDTKVWILSFVSCCFEGTIFLLVFFWPGALQDAHDREHPDAADSIPHGVIMAAFMAIMVLGAIFFNTVTGYTSTSRDAESLFTRAGRYIGKRLGPTSLLGCALLFSSLSFLIAALVRAEVQLFCAFLLLELCSGVYVPSIAFHRSAIVSDRSRTSIYAIMNIPLFVFVVGAICTTGSSRTDHRQIVFFLCAGLLLLASVATFVGLRGSLKPAGFSELPDSDSDWSLDDDDKCQELKRGSLDDCESNPPPKEQCREEPCAPGALK